MRNRHRRADALRSVTAEKSFDPTVPWGCNEHRSDVPPCFGGCLNLSHHNAGIAERTNRPWLCGAGRFDTVDGHSPIPVAPNVEARAKALIQMLSRLNLHLARRERFPRGGCASGNTGIGPSAAQSFDVSAVRFRGDLARSVGSILRSFDRMFQLCCETVGGVCAGWM